MSKYRNIEERSNCFYLYVLKYTGAYDLISFNLKFTYLFYTYIQLLNIVRLTNFMFVISAQNSASLLNVPCYIFMCNTF